MTVARGEGAQRDAANEPLPEWLWEELIELVEAFDHLPQRARRAAMKRNLSPRAHEYFDARAAQRVRELDDEERRG